MDTKHGLLILDANALIDYYRCNREIFKLVCTHIGQIYLAKPVFDEVTQINTDQCTELGIILIEPELDDLLEAGGKRGRLSFQDHLCLILAKKHGLTCVTNDKPLRRECTIEKVPLIWGIELICILVESGGLDITRAKSFIIQMQQNNPKYFTDEIIKLAFTRLGCI